MVVGSGEQNNDYVYDDIQTICVVICYREVEGRLRRSKQLRAARIWWHRLLIMMKLKVSMTQLWKHTVAHSTMPSFRPKANNQPIKKFFSIATTWVNVVKMCKNSDFQSQFSMSKMIRSFLIFFFIEEYHLRSTFFVIDIFWQFQFLSHFIF